MTTINNNWELEHSKALINLMNVVYYSKNINKIRNIKTEDESSY